MVQCSVEYIFEEQKATQDPANSTCVNMSPKKKRTKYMCLTSVLDCGKLHFGFQDFFNPAMPLFLHLTHVIRSQPSNTHWNDFKRQLPLLIHVKRQPVLYQKQRCVCVCAYTGHYECILSFQHHHICLSNSKGHHQIYLNSNA